MQGLEVGGWGLKHKISSPCIIPAPSPQTPLHTSLRPKGVAASVKARAR